MIDLNWDEAGYPDDSVIEEITEYSSKDFDREEGSCWNFLKRVLQECADRTCASFELRGFKDLWDAGREKEEIVFTTGGWSGAESLAYAIGKNVWLYQYIYRWERGGMYVFHSR